MLLSSYAFYGAWDYRFLALIWLSTWVDFEVGRRLQLTDEATARRKLLRWSILVNLGILGFFKYFNFFGENLSKLLGIPLDSVTLHIVLPVGISFYTFQSMSYSIDVYRNRLKACDNFLDFALYVAFFPQLVAGPIERAGRLLTQIRKPRQTTVEDVEVGLYLLSWGFFKKVVVADNMGIVADSLFANPHVHWGWDVWLGVTCFAVQIYGDFSGYSSIARGLARLMGFELCKNFVLPYFALTPSDFWRRWHISLSQWLRDYLYVPLGGNRGGSAFVYRNLLITMVLGGIWHGAAWNFVLWGAYHGVILSVYRALGIRPSERWFMRIGQWIVMTLLTLFGWVLFRVGSVHDVYVILSHLGFSSSPQTWLYARSLLLFAGPMFLLEAWQQYRRDLLVVCRSGLVVPVLFHVVAISSILVFGVRTSSQFLYFQF